MSDVASKPDTETITARPKLRCTVIELTKTDGPDGAEGANWYRYVIHNPGSPITGYRRGNKKEVLAYLEECTNQMEERINPKRSTRKR